VNGFFLLASFAITAAILYFAKAVFIPIAVALLFTFLLTPVVVRLQKWKLPKPIAIVTTASLAFGVVAIITWLVASQLLSLAEQLPRYEQNLQGKIRSLKGPQQPGALSRAAEVIKGVQRDLENSAANPSASKPEPGTEEKPLAVEVKAPKPTTWHVIRSALGPLLSPLATAGIVVILVLAMLFKREDLRDRFIKVVSRGRLNVATEAVDDAARRISRYLFMQLVVNVTYGIPIGVGLYFIGVPNALLWALLATLLRFIPYLGPWIAAMFPIALAFAVDPGWSKLMLTVGLFVIIELISNNLVEPWLYGNGTGVSVVAVIGGAIFWTWLWGPVGLFLATPLTVCLVVMGKYVPGLKFLNEMFGSDPVLEPHARLYQRMLAMDAEEMLRLAEEYLEQKELAAFYDQVLIPALIMAEEDRQTGALAEMRQKFIFQSSRELIEELGEREAAHSLQGPMPRRAPVLCLPAKDDADEIAALMLVQLLQLKNVSAEVIAATTAAEECQSRVHDSSAVCVSALPPSALIPARRVARKLKQKCPRLKVFVGVWTPTGAVTELSARLSSAHVEGVITTLRDAVQQLAGADAPVSPSAPNISSAEASSRLPIAALRSTEPEEILDVVKREVAKTFDVPISLVSIVDGDSTFWRTHGMTSREASEVIEPLRDSSICTDAAGSAGPVVVEDVSKDKRFAEDPFLQSRGIRAYVAAPLRTRSGHVVGTLCVLDTKPRTIEGHALEALRAVADHLMEMVEARPLKAA
jgi:predicted PurR-regulated permease PerM